MAEDFPKTVIIGTDLSLIQPNWAPLNCYFFVDADEKDSTFTTDEAFDYIHSRSMGGGIENWQRYLRQAYNHVKSGGWVEFQEYETWVHSDDGTDKQAVMIQDWQQRLNELSSQSGRVMNIAPELRGLMEESGFINVADDTYKCPVGSWAKNPRLKELGQVGQVTLFEAVEPYTLALFTRELGWTYGQAKEYVNKVRAQLRDTRYHIYVIFHYIYGQRPLNGRT